MTALASDAIGPRTRGLAPLGPARYEALRSTVATCDVRAAVSTSDIPLSAQPAVADDVLRPSLSTREVEVLLAWLAAESKEEAAARLYISASTVSTHISRIRAKYAEVSRIAPTKTHLLARALQDGLTTLDDW